MVWRNFLLDDHRYSRTAFGMGSMELWIQLGRRGAYYPDRPLAARPGYLADWLGLPQGARIAAFPDRPGRREAAGLRHRPRPARSKSTAGFRWLTEPHGRLIFAPSIPRSVSQRCLLIHPEASCSEPNLPKYLVVPLGHAICTRQRSPSFTDVKTVPAPPITQVLPLSTALASLIPTLRLIDRRRPSRGVRWT